MKVCYGWLKEYLPHLKLGIEELAEKFTALGFAVEGIEKDTLTLDIPSNRPDCLSMLGIAREVAVVTNSRIKTPAVKIKSGYEGISRHINVNVIDKKSCPRYTARVVTGVKIVPSPAWLVKWLEDVGIRPLNNIVDITNFILMETGQPLHAFDLAFLNGRKIIVRRADKGEKIVAIDGKEYELTPEMLMIADEKRSVAIAGVMGGKDSEINSATKDVVIESAYFEPTNIRRTSSKLGLSSESSYRFERGVNIEMVDWASQRAAVLMSQIGGGKIAKGVIDTFSRVPATRKISLKVAKVGKVLGNNLPNSKVKKVLNSLGGSTKGGEKLEVKVPVWRSDIKHDVDLIEEIARINGYDKIPSDADLGLRLSDTIPIRIIEKCIKNSLNAMGYFEVMTSSFGSESRKEELSFWSSEPPITLQNPKWPSKGILRKSIVPQFLQVIRVNNEYGERLENIFEIAKLYYNDVGTPREFTVLCIATKKGFLELKGALTALFNSLNVANTLKLESHAVQFLKDAVMISCKGEKVGYFGEILPNVLIEYDLKRLNAPLAVCELALEKVYPVASIVDKDATPIPRHHPITRDVAITIREDVKWEAIEDIVRKSLYAERAKVEGIEFFDLYRGTNISEGEKSVAFSIAFRLPEDKPNTKDNIENALGKVISELEGKLGAKLRK